MHRLVRHFLRDSQAGVVAEVAAEAVVVVAAAVAVVVEAVVEAINHTAFIPEKLLIQWHITEECNLACQHCYQETQTAGVGSDGLDIILARIRDLIADLCRKAGGRKIPAHITVTGGEPFLRDDFFTLLEQFHALRNEFSFAILSNGSLIDTQLARQLSKLKPGFVQLSLDGKKATHDRIRCDGDFDRVMRAATCLKKAGIPLLIAFTAQRDNFREFADVAATGRTLGARRVWADRFIPLGGSKEERDRVLLPSETREFFEIMQKSRKGGGIFNTTEIAMHRALQFLIGGGKPYRCQAGGGLITILANGDLCPCRRMPIPVGNLLLNSLATLYQENRLFRKLRDKNTISHSCRECFYAQVCNGGLRCLGHSMHGELYHTDPGCWLINGGNHGFSNNMTEKL